MISLTYNLMLHGTLTPQPPLPSRERRSKPNFWFPSPLLGEGLRVRV